MKAPLAAVAILAVTPAVAQEASFTGVGQLPGGDRNFALDVSADGSVVVGYGAEAFRWTRKGGLVGLGDLDGPPVDSRALAVSADGRVIVGEASGRPARWVDGVASPLGELAPGQGGVALGVSADGAVIVGWADTLVGREAFRWTEATGIVSLGALGTDPIDAFASDASADGSVVTGQSMSDRPNVEAIRWTEATGMVGLGDVPGGFFYALGFAISDDGGVICGSAIGDSGDFEAFRWTEAGGLEQLDSDIGSRFSSSANAISADGSLIVGYAEHLGDAMLWDERRGFRGLRTMLEDDFGLDLGGWRVGSAEGVSIAGGVATLVGYGLNPSGANEGWVATIPLGAPTGCRAGTVNAGMGPRANVLFVNGSAGLGRDRRVTLAAREPIEFRIDIAPSGPAAARYAAWAWAGDGASPAELEVGGELLGCVILPTPLHAGAGPSPIRCLAGTGLPPALCRGTTTVPSPPRAPFAVLRAGGLARPITLTLQGILEDDGARARGFSVTNAVVVTVE